MDYTNDEKNNKIFLRSEARQVERKMEKIGANNVRYANC